MTTNIRHAHGTEGTRPLILAITACPTGIAHTYMAAENLQAAADELGVDIKIETHGSIGVEGHFTRADVEAASAVIIAADTVIPKDRFVGKRVIATDVDQGIKRPKELIERALQAPKLDKAAITADAEQSPAPGARVDDAPTGLKGVGQTMFKALMNGVSHMIPFVVTGGLLIAVALSIGGTPTPEGLAIPEGSFWSTINELGALAFSLLVPVLSGYIAMGIADRPGLAPGFITGLIATTGSLYGSEAGAGFIGGIVTGILSGYVALAIKKIPVHKFVAPIWPIIVIPILTTLIVGLLFIYIIGHPLASLFEALTAWLAGMDGTSAVALGAIIGAMIAFDMGGPFNKTAFLFGGGLIAAGNAGPMGMAAVAIAVPPLAVGVATLIRRAWFNKAERDAGIAALFMGFFGITEGAIPLAAARPLQVIPANVIGGATAGAVAGMLSVEDNVMHGGPIVAVLGAVDNVLGFFIALIVGVAVTAGLILVLVGLSNRTTPAAHAAPQPRAKEPLPADTAPTPRPTGNPAVATKLLTPGAVVLSTPARTREQVISALTRAAASTGRVTDPDKVIAAALAREEQRSTGVGNGVAIPHARTAGVTEPVLAFARLPEPGVTWADGEEPTRLAFLIAVPEDSGKKHLKLLSKLARGLMKDDFRRDLLEADSASSITELVNARMQ